MIYKVIKQTGLGVMEAPYEDEDLNINFDNLEDAKKKAHELFVTLVPKEIRESTWCYESYYVKDENNKRY